jgi:hypothetical protein
LDQLNSYQLSEWEAYDRLDPIGSWRDDFRISYIASLLTNLTIRVHGKRGAQLTEVKDFLFDWSGDFKRAELAKKQSPEEMKATLMTMFGGNIKQGKRKERK